MRSLCLFHTWLSFLIKVVIVIVFSVSLIRVAIARLKIDQIVYTSWLWITLLAWDGLICIMSDQQMIVSDWNLLQNYQPIVTYLGI